MERKGQSPDFTRIARNIEHRLAIPRKSDHHEIVRYLTHLANTKNLPPEVLLRIFFNLTLANHAETHHPDGTNPATLRTYALRRAYQIIQDPSIVKNQQLDPKNNIPPASRCC